MTKPDQQADATAQRDQQLLFDWTPKENIQASQTVTREADEPAEASYKVDAFAAPCPSPSPESLVESSHEGESHDEHRYPPNHPWHYTREGDNASPVPFDDIPPAEDYGRSLERDLPKPAAKRIVKARQLLETESRDLREARTHYEDIIARGADALSRYDREIAYGGNDELARAGTLALLYNQIAWRRGRIAFLEQLQSRSASHFR